MPDWDARRYHRLSEPQTAWGRKVLARLQVEPGDRVLDIGCGTGRLTAELAARPDLFVVALDRSAAMIAQARGQEMTGIRLVHGDGAALPFARSFDAVFSTATFHWIPDHPRLFGEIYRSLRPGGRLVAQCGGGPNLQRLLDRAHELMDGRYAAHFPGWTDPWNFAGVTETLHRLERAGFQDIDVSLEAAPTSFADAASFQDFIACVCVRHHVDRLPPAERTGFVEALAAGAASDDPPFTLDYWRLNMAARKGRDD